MKTRDLTMNSKMSGLRGKTAVCLLSYLSSRHESCCWDASATCATFLRAVKDIDKAGCLLNPGYQPWVYAHYLCCDRAPRRTWLRTPAFILNQKFEASDSAYDPSLVGTACEKFEASTRLRLGHTLVVIATACTYRLLAICYTSVFYILG